MKQPGVVAGNFTLSFSLNFWAFLCISKAPLGQSLWSGHHWKDLFLQQKSSIDDANFGQKWWRQKRKKGQGLSWAVTGGTGVNGLMTLVSAPHCEKEFVVPEGFQHHKVLQSAYQGRTGTFRLRGGGGSDFLAWKNYAMPKRVGLSWDVNAKVYHFPI